MSYRVRRIDKNQPEITSKFREMGCSVGILSSLGKGIPDLVIGLLRASGERYTALVEVKDGEKPKSAQKLTPDEQKFMENWKGNYHIVTSIEDVVELVNSLC